MALEAQLASGHKSLTGDAENAREAAPTRTPASLSLQPFVRCQLRQVLDRLTLSASSLELFDALTRESLAGIALSGPVPRFSTINNDGVPFQMVASLGGGRPGIAYITEVGIPGSSVPNRIDLTRLRLAEVLPLVGAARTAGALDVALRALLPAKVEELTYWRGGLWVAVACGADGSRLKVYVNARRRSAIDSWQVVLGTLEHAGRDEAVRSLSSLLPLVAPVALPAGAAIDVEPSGLGVIKVYARLDGWSPRFFEDLLGATGLERYGDALAGFAREVFAVRPPPPRSLVLSLEFGRDDGEVDVKLDACAHCHFTNDADTHLTCVRVARELDLPLQPYEAIAEAVRDEHVDDGPRHHAFLGLGLAHREAPRFNVYLKPALRPPTLPPGRAARTNVYGSRRSSLRARLRDSADRATAFLVETQAPSGQWLDFMLKPGPSDGWVTPYVGHVLTESLELWPDRSVAAAVERALAWCATATRPDYGWGYNAFTDTDADSTAWAILFLRANRWDVPPRCASELASFQRPDGGFATFQNLPPGDSWCTSHPDVTPIAVRALLSLQGEEVDTGAAAQFVRRSQADAGYWNSFWWTTPWYATWANLSLVEPLHWRYRRERCAKWAAEQPLPNHAFEVSLGARAQLLISAAADHSRSRVVEWLECLCRMQAADGSWPSSPMLRLTGRAWPEPWQSSESGRVFSDPRRLFSTATALGAIVDADRAFG